MLNRQAKTILAAAILLATTSAMTACNTHLCTAIGCGNHGIVVDVQRSDDGEFPDARYAVTLDLGSDGLFAVDCDFAASVAPVTCSSDEPGSQLQLVIDEFGSMMITFYTIGNGPATQNPFRVTITQAGATIVDQTYAADFEVTFPNGEECGSCYGAQVSAIATAL